MQDCYEILEVNPKASPEVIKKVYGVLAKKYHPDTTVLDKDLAKKHMALINEAYGILSDQARRKEYDSIYFRSEASIYGQGKKNGAVPQKRYNKNEPAIQYAQGGAYWYGDMDYPLYEVGSFWGYALDLKTAHISKEDSTGMEISFKVYIADFVYNKLRETTEPCLLRIDYLDGKKRIRVTYEGKVINKLNWMGYLGNAFKQAIKYAEGKARV